MRINTLSPLVSFNSKIFSHLDASIRSISSAALYGRGIFTTIAICDGEPFLWKKHWRRLEDNAAKLRVDLEPFSEPGTKQTLDEIIEKNGVVHGRARITFFDESQGGIWNLEPSHKSSLLIMTGDLRPIPDSFRLTLSPYRVNSASPLTGVKSCNYLENLLAFGDANSRGYDEAIRLNERGEVTSGCMANVFWIVEEKLYTPSLKTGCLPGTTRELILENIECDEVERGFDDLRSANAIFLTSAGLGIVRVGEFQGRALDQIPYNITALAAYGQ